ncbi:MAG TPA: radical SAM protein [Acidimicrobiales bacterium]|nr:radical SAM protein [Acidimicrobiales bacterium]
MSLAFSRYNVWAEVGDQAAVYNGTTGSFSVLSTAERDQVIDFVERDGPGEGIDALLTDLVTRRVIVRDHTDELGELRRRYDDSRWRSDALAFTVVTSLGCNFDCPYCFEDKHPSLLKPEVADALVGILTDSLPAIGQLSVTWMGGEPLLGKAQLLALSERLIEVCTRHGKEYQASIITNGWHLDGPTAAALAAARVRSAQVTIDGPPDVHDLKRPHVNGGPTFERIVANLAEAADHLDVVVRINVDTTNAHRVDELLAILADAGLAGRIGVGLGRITDAVSNAASPLASFTTTCLSTAQFGEFELAFTRVAESYGFAAPSPPRPTASPCTAVRAREIVVGADGEMWKCWDDIGDPDQLIGTVFDYTVTNDRLDRWLGYHPADDPQCSTCIAMPVCMGGCAHHHFNSDDPEARCGAFRHNHVGRITQVLERVLGVTPDEPPSLPRYDLGPAQPAVSTAVALGPTRRRRDHLADAR